MPPVININYALDLVDNIELVATPKPEDIYMFSTIAHIIWTKNSFSKK